MCDGVDTLLAEGGRDWTPLLVSFVLWGFAKLRHLPCEETRAAVEQALAR